MCTVSFFYKGNNDFVLTSSRDEAPNRNALSPEFYTINNTQLLMPKDEQSGGSWVGASSKNRVVCLLNGGFKLHKRKESYRQSRGVVVTDFLSMENIESALKNYNFDGIEPFTLIIIDWNTNFNCLELVWDETKIHFQSLPLEAKIWSSSTLYTEKQKQVRRNWFEAFKAEKELNSKSLLKFHKFAGKGNDNYGVIMDRGVVKTTSITQIEKTNNALQMCFLNLNTQESTTSNFNFTQTSNA